MTQPDLFSHSPAQGEMFADHRPPQNLLPDPADIRRRLLKMLGEARAAESKSPWDARKTRLYATIFPQMANWLPPEEADGLRAEFAAQIERFKRAA
jgi:hypothetical protein